MFEILIKIPGKAESKGKLVPGVYRVGSGPASHLQLDTPAVSGRHAQFIVSETNLKVVDMVTISSTDASLGSQAVQSQIMWSFMW